MNNILVKFKSWQLTLVLVGIISALNLSISWSNIPILIRSKTFILLMSSTIVILSYWWNVSISLSKVNNEVVGMKKSKINLILYVSVIMAISTLIFGVTRLFGGIGAIGNENGVNAVFITQKALTYTIPMLLLFFLFICVSAAVTAKQLKSNEEKRNIENSGYMKDFILILFFPIGIWFTQRRVNRLFIDI